jgi:lipopolysaccharide/colanic/teichoic acid biosynthesis glycosyltransferase
MLGTTDRDQPVYMERAAVSSRSIARPSDKSAYVAAKRLMDVVLSICALAAIFPLCALIALAIKLTDGGPVLFWQKRVGKDGVEFWFPKFRSMVTDAERKRRELLGMNHHGGEGVTFKIKNDPRITPVGSLLRKFSLDELPQFWSVLKGDMSLVGPRPALPVEVAQYNDYERQRLSVIPGLTCFWQVQGRANIPFEQQVELDLRYIAERSLLLDIMLLLKTLPAVILARGAY